MTYCMIVMQKNPRFSFRKELVQYTESYGIKAATRRFCCSRNTVRKWYRRFKEHGLRGLNELSRAPRHCPHKTSPEQEKKVIEARNIMPAYGAERLKEEFELKPSCGAIKRILRQNGLTKKHRKKHQKKNDLREVKRKYKAFTYFQVDVKYLRDIPNYWPQMKRLELPEYQYTCRDIKTGAMFLSYSYVNSVSNSCFFIERILNHLKKHNLSLKDIIIQTDNGGEFSGTFTKEPNQGFQFTVEKEYKAKQRFIPPKHPNANADVETVHDIIEDEFFDYEQFLSLDDFIKKVTTYQYHFNLARKNSYKGKKTPLDILMESTTKIPPSIFNLPPILLDHKHYDKKKFIEESPYFQWKLKPWEFEKEARNGVTFAGSARWAEPANNKINSEKGQDEPVFPVFKIFLAMQNEASFERINRTV